MLLASQEDVAFSEISISLESMSGMSYPSHVAEPFEDHFSCSSMACKSHSVVEWQPTCMLSPFERTLGREIPMNDPRSPDMVSRLRNSGKRITPERKLLLQIIEQNAHLDAEEIYRIAQKDRPQIGLATVYRTLTLLKDLGIICTTDLGENHYHYEVRSKDHVHLVCSMCGRVTDIPVPKALYKAAGKEQFAVQRTHFEMFGICRSCTDTPSASSEVARG